MVAVAQLGVHAEHAARRRQVLVRRARAGRDQRRRTAAVAVVDRQRLRARVDVRSSARRGPTSAGRGGRRRHAQRGRRADSRRRRVQPAGRRVARELDPLEARRVASAAALSSGVARAPPSGDRSPSPRAGDRPRIGAPARRAGTARFAGGSCGSQRPTRWACGRARSPPCSAPDHRHAEAGLQLAGPPRRRESSDTACPPAARVVGLPSVQPAQASGHSVASRRTRAHHRAYSTRSSRESRARLIVDGAHHVRARPRAEEQRRPRSARCRRSSRSTNQNTSLASRVGHRLQRHAVATSLLAALPSL